MSQGMCKVGRVGRARLNTSSTRQRSVNTYLGIGGQAFEESVLTVDFFEDDQTLPSLAGVVRHSLVLTEEEESVQKAINGLEHMNSNRAATMQLTRVPRVAT